MQKELQQAPVYLRWSCTRSMPLSSGHHALERHTQKGSRLKMIDSSDR